MKSDLPIIPVFADGNATEPGNSYVNATTGWYAALHDTTRVKPNVPRFAEWVQRFGCFMLRNALYLDQPMRIDQQSALLAAAAAASDNADLQARADIAEFERAQRDYFENGFDIYHYVGSPRTFARVGNESIPVWYHRLRKELDSQVRYSSRIFCDATMGTHTAFGEWWNEALRFALRELRKEVPIGCEPTNWWHDRELLGEAAKFISRDWLMGREDANPDSATTWLQRKATPTFHGDPSPMQIPGILGEPVLIWLDFKDPTEKRDPIGNIMRTHERWPHAKLACPFGWLPKELLA